MFARRFFYFAEQSFTGAISPRYEGSTTRRDILIGAAVAIIDVMATSAWSLGRAQKTNSMSSQRDY
jgi:hypothetical protein